MSAERLIFRLLADLLMNMGFHRQFLVKSLILWAMNGIMGGAVLLYLFFI
jgi:hypothetical protein